MKKTEKEIEYEKWEDEYKKTFNQVYPVTMEDCHPFDWHIKRIKHSIKTGVALEWDDIPDADIY